MSVADLPTLGREVAALVDTDPAEVARVALPAELLAGLPAQALPFLEQSTDESGDLEVFHVDHVVPSGDYYLYFLNTTKGKYSLHFADVAPDLLTGAKVRVHGVKIDNAIVVADAADVIVSKAVAVLSNTLGVQKTLTILVNFSDAPTTPFDATYAQNVMFATTSNYDYETSYRKLPCPVDSSKLEFPQRATARDSALAAGFPAHRAV